ncbi:MAG TPA: primosomal protein N' [Treponema sp.]|jgi:primosomal protein N' (replication factor Y)|nr:primosomal protein N' [Treponema sp.]HAK69379.1 primosomal protein N' [Treponema sp.]HCA19318.1 primosomal protein N' [Treponema sp.]
MSRYIDVVLNLPLNQAFTYHEPLKISEEDKNASEDVLFGRRVEVRFGNRRMTGIVTALYDTLPPTCSVGEEKIRAAAKYVDTEPVLTRELYESAKWVSRYYLTAIGEAVFAMIPSGKRESDASGFSFSDTEDSFEKKNLSGEQQAAVNGILDGDEKRLFHYLYGKTGSGKTEVFLSAAEKILEKNKGVIYLVPEIGLTPQVVKAVVRRFGNTAAVLHSELTPSQRLSEWRRILHREARIVVGARSAVFAPVPDLGMIVIDEEHDASYKAGSTPRYHARQVAMHRCTTLGIPLVMGSATPSLEAWSAMENGTIKRHTLTQRLAGGAMPEIKSVNLSLEQNKENCLSRELKERMKAALAEKRQIILFLNRRGFTHFFRCSSCGFEMKCKNCSVSMTYHKAENRLRCHYCGYSIQPPHQCPKCGSLDVGYSGFGTEYIEAEVKATFPNEKILRVDTDSVSHKGELQEKLDAFRKGEYSILLGTQMVAKGLNFPALKLVGVILADSSLHLPDFRASERTFALITQVAGRAGRFFPDGEVIVQSYSPDMEPIALAVKGDIDTFYANEIKQRNVLGFPPFVRMLRLVFRSSVPGAAEKAAEGAAVILRKNKIPGTDIMGPAECPIELVAGNWRHQILLRGKNIGALQKMASNLLNGYTAPQNVYIESDVDPVSLL